jgi:SAM-dependent methyltransferase
MRRYDTRFFTSQRDGSLAAARTILPIIWDKVAPARVVDLGCGVGAWLKASLDLGARSVIGLDGSYAAAEQLTIPPSSFIAADLEAPLPTPSGDFDLAICVEVLEHLSPSAGERAVAWLCQQAPVVLFSAAVPGQVGEHHINEDWLSSWRTAFRASGHELYDIIRPAVWTDPNIAFWYRQNMVVFARPDHAARYGLGAPATDMIDVIHPDLYNANRQRFMQYYRRSLSGALTRLFETATGRPFRHTDPREWRGPE